MLDLQDDNSKPSFLRTCSCKWTGSGRNHFVLGPVIKTEPLAGFTLHACEQPEAGSPLKDQWKTLKLPPEALSVFFSPPIALLLLLSSLFMRTPDPSTVCFKFDHADVSLGD